MVEYLQVFDSYGNAFVNCDLNGKNPQVVELRTESRYYESDALHRIFVNIKFHRELIEEFGRENNVGDIAFIEDTFKLENPICVGKFDTDIEYVDDNIVEFPSCQNDCEKCEWSDWCYLPDKDFCAVCKERLCDRTDFCKFD